jgi:hypothetical protein
LFLQLSYYLNLQLVRRNGTVIVEKGIKQLESRKLKLMEDIYDLQKQYDKQKKLNQDIIDPHVKVEITK